MAGLGALAVAAAPVAGGLLVGAMAGNLRGPDLRAGIKADLELLEHLREDDVGRRAALQRVIDRQLDILNTGTNEPAGSTQHLVLHRQGQLA